MSRFARNLLFAVGVLLAGALTWLFWSSRRPPAVSRLLPEADAIVYANLRPARLATHFDRSAPKRAPAYEGFVEATGIVPERDLDEVAFALTRRPAPEGPNGPVAYTEVFRGRFDADRLTTYLARAATATELYAGDTIYTLPSGDPGVGETRLLRVVVLRKGLIAASNAPTPEQIHAVLDRVHAGWFSQTAPSLLTQEFHEIPILSTAWGLGSLGLPFMQSGHVTVMGMELPVPADQPVIASLRYVGVLRVRIAALAPTPELAMQQTGAMTGLLGVVRSLGETDRTTNPQIRAMIDSITVARLGEQTVLTVDVPPDLLRRLASAP